MPTAKQLLKILAGKVSFTDINNPEPVFPYTQDEHMTILSLLSQSTGPGGQSEGAPIKLSAGSPQDPAGLGGDRFLTQEVFNRMYTHYSDLCDKEDTNSWWENQFYMLKAQQQQGMRWVKASERLPDDKRSVCTRTERLDGTCYYAERTGKELSDYKAKDGDWFKTIEWLDESAPLSQQQQQREWISIKDGLPPREENGHYSQVPCLVNKRYQYVRNGKEGFYYQIQILIFNHAHECWDNEDGDDYNCDIENVTHWMPLPPPPTPQDPADNQK